MAAFSVREFVGNDFFHLKISQTLVIVSMVAMFFPFSSGLHTLLAYFSALLFSAYIVFDTQNIIKRVSPEEYILSSVELYLDVLNVFLAILRILGDRRN